jgi:hypothetical protein
MKRGNTKNPCFDGKILSKKEYQGELLSVSLRNDQDFFSTSLSVHKWNSLDGVPIGGAEGHEYTSRSSQQKR